MYEELLKKEGEITSLKTKALQLMQTHEEAAGYDEMRQQLQQLGNVSFLASPTYFLFSLLIFPYLHCMWCQSRCTYHDSKQKKSVVRSRCWSVPVGGILWWWGVPWDYGLLWYVPVPCCGRWVSAGAEDAAEQQQVGLAGEEGSTRVQRPLWEDHVMADAEGEDGFVARARRLPVAGA